MRPIGFFGVLVVLRPGFETINPWLFATLAATFFISGLFLLARALDENETIVSLALFPALSNLILITPVAFLLYGFPEPADLYHFALQAVFVLIGLAATAKAFRIARASLVSPFHYTQIIWGVLFGYYLFGDVPDVWTILGSSIIIGSGLYLILTERKAARFERERL